MTGGKGLKIKLKCSIFVIFENQKVIKKLGLMFLKFGISHEEITNNSAMGTFGINTTFMVLDDKWQCLW